MEGQSSGTIDCRHAGAHCDVILECPDRIWNNLQVGSLFMKLLGGVCIVLFFDFVFLRVILIFCVPLRK